MDDLKIVNARVYSMSQAGPAAPDERLRPEADSFAVSDGRIVAFAADGRRARAELDLDGQCVLPGLIDCHTHALHAGDRLDEYAARLAGESYERIAARGGGIRATVRAVRAASIEELNALARPRLDALLREGVTTVEIKSGYGLEHAAEIRMLEAIRELARSHPLDIESTYLGAHAVPEGRSAEDYLDEILQRTLPEVAERGLARAVDVYVERIAFDTEQAQRLFRKARELGLGIRAHTEQLSACGGTRLACEHGAWSCDHLEYADADDADALARAGTVAVLLPGAFYCLRETRKPPVGLLRTAGAAMAVATDLNPGTSPVGSLLTCLHMSVVLFGLSPAEALLGVTRHAAQALGRGDDIGTLAPGKLANFTVWDLPAPEWLAYYLGGQLPRAVYIGGRRV